MRTALLVLSLSLTSPFFIEAQEPLFPRRVSPHAKKAVEAINQLRTIGVPDCRPRFSHAAWAGARPAPQAKSELKALIIEDLNAVPEEEEILAQLRAAGWHEMSSNKWRAYG